MFFPILFKHPLTKGNIIPALAKYARWHLLKLLGKDQFIYNWFGKVKIYVSRKDSAALVNYYTGLYEFEEMCFLLHFMREKDLLIDAGANVGVFSLLASGQIGSRSIAFEPIPATFKRLEENIRLNKLQDIITQMNIGLGSDNKIIKFTNGLENSINRVANETDKDIINVEVRKLDDVLTSLSGYESILLKIDVEGFEAEVLFGAENLLKRPQLKAIIIELNGSGEQFGFDENNIRLRLHKEGFELYYYNPFSRVLSKTPPPKSWGNTIYIRDTEFVKKRLAIAPKFVISNKSI